VLQSYVYGDSLKSYLVAVIVPNLENLIPWARQNGINVSRVLVENIWMRSEPGSFLGREA
jgi:long-subunit acyl-CoA synthetase (AMP-forming)